jgi:PTH1 family peptidyl-tRNA hydrolase
MKLIVGLGNVGDEYKDNRHNVGFMVVERFASTRTYREWESKSKLVSQIINIKNQVVLAKPETMMNDSGKSVSALASYYKLHATDLFIVHDDLDIKLGEYKIQKGKGPKDHKGLNSIYEKLGTKDFWHVRVGINNDTSRIADDVSRLAGDKYVLQDFTEDEKEVVDQVIEKIIEDLIARVID